MLTTQRSLHNTEAEDNNREKSDGDIHLFTLY